MKREVQIEERDFKRKEISYILCGNLTFKTTESDLFKLFGIVTGGVNARAVCNRQTHCSKGLHYLSRYKQWRRHVGAVAELHDKEHIERKLIVGGARIIEEQRQTF